MGLRHASEEERAGRQVDPRSLLLITLDSCRYDTFLAAEAPNLKSVGPEIHRAQAPSHFTYASHAAMFVGFTPGVAGANRPYVNPKFSKFFRIANRGRLAFGPAAFELEGRTIIEGFGRCGYRTIGSAALPWFNPETPMGAAMTADFHRFLYAGALGAVDRQAAWVDQELDAVGDAPVFAFLNVGETHVPYWHQGAAWPATDNPCMPFQTIDRAADCALRQRACLEYVDKALAGLSRRFAQASIIITADHGDCWGEDGLWEHGISHAATLTVPLVFKIAPEVEADRARRHAIEGVIASAQNAAMTSSATEADHRVVDDGADPLAAAPPLTLDSVVALRKDIVVATIEGEVVLVDARNETYHSTGVTGGRIVGLLEEARPVREIVADLVAAYEVDQDTCATDVLEFLGAIRDQRLLLIVA